MTALCDASRRCMKPPFTREWHIFDTVIQTLITYLSMIKVKDRHLLISGSKYRTRDRIDNVYLPTDICMSKNMYSLFGVKLHSFDSTAL